MPNSTKDLIVDEKKVIVKQTYVPDLPEGFRLKLVHLHQGNSSRKQRHGHSYVTHARIVNKNDKVVARGIAMCSNKDNPSRAIGRRIAIGRVEKEFEACKRIAEHYLDISEVYKTEALSGNLTPLSI